MQNSYSHLLIRLDDFIRRYYKAKWILGLLYLGSASLILLFLFSSFEYFGYYSRPVRFGFLLVFWVFVGLISVWYFLIPFLSYLRLGKRIDYEKASQIIGEHFPEIRDKLLNALQLHGLGSQNEFDQKLIEASINQKFISFSQIPFYAAINQKKNILFFWILAWVFLVSVMILLIFPSLLLQGSTRILSFKTEFTPPAPYEISILNKELSGLRNGEFLLKIKVSGHAVPSDLAIDLGGSSGNMTFPFTANSDGSFTYLFNNLQNDIPFRIYGAGFYSKYYTLAIHSVPRLLSFKTIVTYPKYLNKPVSFNQNNGDLTVPEGCQIKWIFQTKDCDSLIFYRNPNKSLLRSVNGSFSISERANQEFEYSFIPKNTFIKTPDTFHYQIKVIKDAYPEIMVGTQDSSKIEKKISFSGQIKDDYGFSGLFFHYYYPKSSGLNPKIESFRISIPLRSENQIQNFFMELNLAQLKELKGKQISYYFEVLDNDEVNGHKSSKTLIETLHLNSSQEELIIKKGLETSVESQLKKAAFQARKIESDTKSLYQKVSESNQLSFDQVQGIKNIFRDKSLLDSTLSKASKENQRSQNLGEQKYTPSTLSKNENEMKNLLDHLVSKETKDLLDKLNKLLSENRISEAKKTLRDFSTENKSVSSDIKRAEELYQKLIRDRDIQNQIDQIHELAKKEKLLSEKSSPNSKTSPKDLKKAEADQQKNYETIKKNLEELEKTNQKDQANPDFSNPKNLEEEISKGLESSQESLTKNEKEKASKTQKNTSANMDELGFSLSKMKQVMDAEELSIDLHSLRQILENLIRISYKQESLLQSFQSITSSDPAVIQYTKDQFSLKESIKQTEDSLISLSKKVPVIERPILKEVKQIDGYLEQVTDLLSDRKLYEVPAKQQFVMTYVNNLALILSNIEKQMAAALSRAKGNGSGSGTNPSLSSLIMNQKGINKQLSKMGSATNGNGEKDNETLIRLVSEQEAIRRELFGIGSKTESRGKLANQLKEIQKEIEESETDLLNRRINSKNEVRQNDILTRMLEAEKSEREQGMDKSFQSNTGKTYNNQTVKPLVAFIKEKDPTLEVLKSTYPSMNFFYKQKTNTYFNLLNDSQSKNEKLGAH